jgi:hypothetical protein
VVSRGRAFDGNGVGGGVFLLLSPAESKSTSIGLSKAKEIKDVVFQLTSQSVGWIPATLKTMPKHRDLRGISICLSPYVTTTGVGGNASQVIGEANWGEWLDLDRLLIRFWESSSIRPKFVHLAGVRELNTRDCVGYQCLLPEITNRGIFDPAESWFF